MAQFLSVPAAGMAVIEIILKAPLSGWAMPLEEVPDQVYSRGLAGAGQAIDPIDGLLVAPCAGEIVQLHRCRHALTLRRSDGVEILMHIGIDSVTLNGQGFRALVALGDRVECGAPLLEFEPDLVATRVRSLISVFVINANPQVKRVQASNGQVRQGEDWMRLQLEPQLQPQSEQGSSSPGSAELLGVWLRLPNPFGMHARPAACLLQLVKELPGQVFVESHGARASARSIVSVLSLDLGCGDSLRLVSTALGRDQLTRLESHVLAGLGDDLSRLPLPVPAKVASVSDENQLWGVVASTGLAQGKVQHWQRPHFDLQPRGGPPGQEERAWQKALRQAATGIEELYRKAPLQQQGIFAAHREILQDPSLLEQCRQGIAQGHSAAWAWHQAYQSLAEKLDTLANPVLAARANDLRDVGERVLRSLLGQAPIPQLLDGCILVADELYPSDVLQLDFERVKGICLAGGDAGSHVAVLARSLEVPAVCCMGQGCLQLTPGSEVILDADRGLLWSHPSADLLLRAQERLQERARQREQAWLAVNQPAVTSDGSRLYVGLTQFSGERLPTEVDFLVHSLDSPPHDLIALATAVGPEKRLILRLPDSASGHQSLRGLGDTLVACAPLCRLGLLVPMVAGLGSWRAARSELEGWIGGSAIEIGLLVEIPSAALLIDKLAPAADFLVLAPTALVRHTLALDRARPELVAKADPLHPALLTLMQRVGQAASRHGKWLAVCETAAQDLEALPIWLGLQVDHLSVESPAIASTKAEVRNWNRVDCQRLLAQALELAEPEEVRQLIRLRARQSTV